MMGGGWLIVAMGIGCGMVLMVVAAAFDQSLSKAGRKARATD